MVKNKKIVFVTFLSLTFSMQFMQACRYDEGPAISFRNWADRIQGTYTIKRILVDNVDLTQQYNDTCKCKFYFPPKSLDIKLINCRSKTNNSEIHGSFGPVESSSYFFQFYGKSGLFDSAYGYGPLNYNLRCIWKIHRLTAHETFMETNFEDKHYRIEMYEDGY